MREILFRGKRTDNGEWVYGYYYVSPYSNRAFIQSFDQDGVNTFEVIPETVGQYTGKEDRLSRKIFDNDIVRLPFCENDVCVFKPEKNGINLYLRSVDGRRPYHIGFENNPESLEVIGNIHDNPELLEVTK